MNYTEEWLIFTRRTVEYCMKKLIYNIGDMTEKQKEEFVSKCEDEFEHQLERAAETIIKEKCRIVTLSGPTCSGKTTTANRFISLLEKAGRRTGVISIDDFYRSRAELVSISAQKGLEKVDYDSVFSIDLDCFKLCIDDIFDGRVTRLPKYGFEEGIRTGYYEFDSSKYDCIILEGIQAVYPEITSLLPQSYKSIQISVATDVVVNGKAFTSRQIRFLRRIIRDAKFRGSEPGFTFEVWNSVSENEDKHIIPFGHLCDIQIDSYMEYEPFMIKTEIMELLKDISRDDPFYHKAEEIRDKFAGFFDISSRYLPVRSVYHEFLG